MSTLSLDFETRSAADLKKSGVHVYAEHPSTDVWCLAWAFDDEDPAIWTPEFNGVCYNELPRRIVDHIRAGGECRAWNAQFERIIWREVMAKKYGVLPVRDEQWVCSAAEAAAMALPRHLGGASKVLGVEQQKDDEGYRLMLRMSAPRRVEPDGTLVWWDVQEKLERLYEYCKQDVRTERSIVRCLRRLTPKERDVYLLDQRVNDRGVRVDLQLVQAAAYVVEVGVERANARLAELTGGDVSKVTNNGRLLGWLNDQDIETESIAKPALAALLARDDMPETVREVLQLRADAGRSSVAKLKAMAYATCADGQARGLLLYHAASTGRWGGRLIQPQNFPRGEVDDVESFIPYVLAGDYHAIDMFAHPIVVVLSMLRSMLTARPGHELMAADYSAIEARVLNWLAGQEDMCELFRKYDAASKDDKPLFDPYRHNAAKLYGIPLEEVQKFPHRQTGKFQELGCGFQMGAKKAVSAAKTVYGLDITDEQANDIVSGYRSTHAMVKRFWYEAEEACIDAVLQPGVAVRFGDKARLKAIKLGAYLYIVLPSGRPLCYAAPSVKEKLTPWGEMKPALHYWGVDPYTKQWGELSLYGGLIVQNVTQAIARDLMAEAMLRLEAAGYLPVLSVHDEVVVEVPEGCGSVKEMERIMSDNPAWATDCPVSAEGWKGFRYRK